MSEEPQIESVGSRLHKARLRKKVTIDQAHKDTKIHPKVLAALEEDRFDEVLSPPYIKAFLKSYCRYLELDANTIATDYEALHKESSKSTLAIKTEKRSEKKNLFFAFDWQKYLAAGRKWILPIGIGVLGLLLGTALIFLATKAVKKIKGIKISKPKIAAVEKSESHIIKPLSIPQTEPLTLIVKVKAGDVWLKVSSDGKTMFQGVLKKGSVEAYKAQEKFQIWSGKAEFMELVLNGNPLGSPGSGVLRKIILTRQGLAVEKK